jgi:hypothetical protein
VELDLWRLAVIAAATVVTYWIAHVYSDGLGESLEIGRRLTPAELGLIARRESSILLAAVMPVAAILLGVLGVFATRTALWVAVGVGVATLAVRGFRCARLERLSWAGTIVTVAINLALGLVIVLLKALCRTEQRDAEPFLLDCQSEWRVPGGCMSGLADAVRAPTPGARYCLTASRVCGAVVVGCGSEDLGPG